MNTHEQQVRAVIDRLLQAAGWAVQCVDAVSLHTACGVAICECPREVGCGFADSLLYVHGKASGVVEAKRPGAARTGVEIHSGRYAQGLRTGPPAWQRPLPLLDKSTGIQTRITEGPDPALRGH